MNIFQSVYSFLPSISNKVTIDQAIFVGLYGLPLATQLSILHQCIKIGSFTIKQSIELLGVAKKNILTNEKEIKLISLKEDKEEDYMVIDSL